MNNEDKNIPSAKIDSSLGSVSNVLAKNTKKAKGYLLVFNLDINDDVWMLPITDDSIINKDYLNLKTKKTIRCDLITEEQKVDCPLQIAFMTALNIVLNDTRILAEIKDDDSLKAKGVILDRAKIDLKVGKGSTRINWNSRKYELSYRKYPLVKKAI